MVELGFDYTAKYHTFQIEYGYGYIKFWVDGKVLRTSVDEAGHPKIPTSPMFMYMSIWDASSVLGGTWAGVANWSKNTEFFQYFKYVAIEKI
jgi:beta-glucanase (GH16 family)